jgi:hypothetical protein
VINLLGPKRQKKYANESSQFLVPPEAEQERFGLQEVIVAFLFALFVAGVHYIQFNHTKKQNAFIEAQVKQLAAELKAPTDSVTAKLNEKIQALYPEATNHRASSDFRLYFVFGASIFFLTSTVLFFFNYEINKISLFMTEITKQIVYIYLSAMAIIVLLVHLIPRGQGIIATHLMLIALCAADTVINRIIASSFDKVGEHYRELAKIFRLAMVSSIALLVLNSYVVLQELLWEKSHLDLPIVNPYGWNLGILVVMQLMAMVVIRDLIREGVSRKVFQSVRTALPQTQVLVGETEEVESNV